MAAELVAVTAAELGVGVDEGVAVPGVRRAETHERVGLLTGQRGRKFAGQGRKRVGEKRADALDGRMIVMQLGVHLQRHARGFGGVGRDVGLEEVFLRIDIRVELRSGGGTHDTVLVEGRGIEEVVDFLGAACHVEVEVLVEGAALEEHIVPVHIGINVGIESQFGPHDFFAGVTWIFAACGTSLVIGFHESYTVGDLRDARRGRYAQLGPHVDGHLLRIAAVLGGDDHHAVGAARSVKGRCRGVFEHRERFDGLGRDVVEHLVGDLHAVEDQQRRLSRTEG